MYQDVVDLRSFYNSPLGRVAKRMLRRQVRRVWPDVRGQRVLGLGYAVPFLRPFLKEAERVIAVMPAPQGVMAWPAEGPNRVCLADEDSLPLPDMSVDRVLLVHGLECTSHLGENLREAWRVLAGGGRLLVLVPNRLGMWARFDSTPFGHGRPYTSQQLSRVLRDHMFVPEQTQRALFLPPLRSRFTMMAARPWEEAGQRWFEALGGVLMIEATKQLYGAAPQSRPMRYRRPVLLPTPQGAAARNQSPRVGPADD